LIIDITQRTWSRYKKPLFFCLCLDVPGHLRELFCGRWKKAGVEIEDSRSCVPKTKDQGSSKLKERWGLEGKTTTKASIGKGSRRPVRACRKGVGSATFFISLQCPRNCYYCFNPNQEYYEYFLTNERDCIKELGQIRAAGGELSHIGLIRRRAPGAQKPGDQLLPAVPSDAFPRRPYQALYQRGFGG
jgi:hypothetical protein